MNSIRYSTHSLSDVSIRKKDNRFETDAYRKPTFTGLCMKISSAISEAYNIT